LFGTTILGNLQLINYLGKSSHLTSFHIFKWVGFHQPLKVREGYSVFVVRGAFPKPGAPEVILQIRSHDTKSNATRCDLEQDHKKLLEAIQGGEMALTVAVLENF